jgi:hypothetical protein
MGGLVKILGCENIKNIKQGIVIEKNCAENGFLCLNTMGWQVIKRGIFLILWLLLGHKIGFKQ